eukprot:2381896-Pleurochrysis_carterae.AAC.1
MAQASASLLLGRLKRSRAEHAVGASNWHLPVLWSCRAIAELKIFASQIRSGPLCSGDDEKNGLSVLESHAKGT